MKTFSIRAICFDWGDTLMLDDGPNDMPMAQWPEVHVVPGAKESLEQLHRRFPLCVATNAELSSAPLVERALERGGLLRFITHVFTAKDLGVKKDSPAFWLKVADTVGVDVGEVAMVGDSLESDVLAPSRFGVHAVWFNAKQDHARPPGVLTVSRLQDFAALFIAHDASSPGRSPPSKE